MPNCVRDLLCEQNNHFVFEPRVKFAANKTDSTSQGVDAASDQGVYYLSCILQFRYGHR